PPAGAGRRAGCTDEPDRARRPRLLREGAQPGRARLPARPVGTRGRAPAERRHPRRARDAQLAAVAARPAAAALLPERPEDHPRARADRGVAVRCARSRARDARLRVRLRPPRALAGTPPAARTDLVVG